MRAPSSSDSDCRWIFFARRGCYTSQIRKKALRIVLLQIYSGHTQHLLQYLSEWPSVEIGLFLREVMLCMPSELTRSGHSLRKWIPTHHFYRSLEESQQPMHIELMRKLNSASQIEVMWAVQFFAQVIVKLEGGPQAFIEAQSPDAILALDMATSLNFFHVHTRDGPQPYTWDDARNVLLQYPETARHRLLATLELRKNSPSHFSASRGFLENEKYLKKRHGTAEEELRIVSPCSSQSGVEFGFNLRVDESQDEITGRGGLLFIVICFDS